jgi:hypothetical protein
MSGAPGWLAACPALLRGAQRQAGCRIEGPPTRPVVAAGGPAYITLHSQGMTEPSLPGGSGRCFLGRPVLLLT